MKPCRSSSARPLRPPAEQHRKPPAVRAFGRQNRRAGQAAEQTHVVGQLDLHQLGHQLGVGQQVAEPKAAERKGLGEGAEDQEVAVAAEQRPVVALAKTRRRRCRAGAAPRASRAAGRPIPPAPRSRSGCWACRGSRAGWGRVRPPARLPRAAARDRRRTARNAAGRRPARRTSCRGRSSATAPALPGPAGPGPRSRSTAARSSRCRPAPLPPASRGARRARRAARPNGSPGSWPTSGPPAPPPPGASSALGRSKGTSFWSSLCRQGERSRW